MLRKDNQIAPDIHPLITLRFYASSGKRLERFVVSPLNTCHKTYIEPKSERPHGASILDISASSFAD